MDECVAVKRDLRRNRRPARKDPVQKVSGNCDRSGLRPATLSGGLRYSGAPRSQSVLSRHPPSRPSTATTGHKGGGASHRPRPALSSPVHATPEVPEKPDKRVRPAVVPVDGRPGPAVLLVVLAHVHSQERPADLKPKPPR